MVLTDPGVFQTGHVQARELVFARACHVAPVLVVVVAVRLVLDEYSGGEAS